eukprot:scaffold8248_cov118-Isochrysis_galbana.AAC.1
MSGVKTSHSMGGARADRAPSVLQQPISSHKPLGSGRTLARTGADASRGTDTTQWSGRSVRPDPVNARGVCASRAAARGRGMRRGQTTLSAANGRNSPGR